MSDRPPRVFISYSHDSAAHCDRVLALARQLRRDGIESELDQFHQHRLQHWPTWCEEQLRPENSRFVLVVCTDEYLRRVEGRVPAEVGKGVFWEGRIISDYIYDAKGNDRFVPVFLDGASEDCVPRPLRHDTHFRLTAFGLGEPAYENLYRLLTDQPRVTPGPVGGIVALAPPAQPLGVPERQTDFARLIDEILGRVTRIESVAVETKAHTSAILDILRGAAPPSSTPARPHNLPPWMAPEFFIGRDAELRALRDGLCAGDGQPLAIVQPQVVKGGGGIGKTRLAIQAAWVVYVGGGCDMAFFLSAASPAELDTQLASLAEDSLLGLYRGARPPTELDARRDAVLHALRAKAVRWILVLDAADSPEARDAVKALFGKLAGGRILFTSRRDDWPVGTVRQIELKVFTPAEARACLRSRHWNPAPSDAELAGFDRIATELEFLPLGLALAASYMAHRRIGPDRYLEDWANERDRLLAFRAPDLEDSRSLLAAFHLSYGLLSPSARALLHILSWLAAEPFPRRLVEASEIMPGLLAGGGEETAGIDVTGALAEIRTLSLLQLDGDAFRLHKLILACARAAQTGPERAGSRESAVRWICEVLPDPDFNIAGWALWGRLGPHLDPLLQHAEATGIEGAYAAVVCSQYGTLLFHQARHGAAEPLMRRALAIAEKSYGPEHPNVATGLNNLAQLLQATNRLAEAEPLMRRALAIDEKSFGPEHPNVAIRLNNLAVLLQATNRLAEAEPPMRRALAIDEKSFGPEHPKVAIRLNNLAQLLQATNRLAEAEPLMRRALAIDEKSYGPEHPEVATDLNNLARLLQATNRLAEAEPLMRRALVILLKFTRATGHSHPNLRRAFGNYDALLNQMGIPADQASERLAAAGAQAGFDAAKFRELLSKLSPG